MKRLLSISSPQWRPAEALTAIALVAALSTAVTAGDRPVVDPGDPIVDQGDCVIGNTNDPVDFVPDIFQGNESYAYFVNPIQQCPYDAPDFELLSVNQYLYFEPQQVPVTFTVQANLLLAVPGADCSFVPGPALCDPTPVSFTVDQPGLFLVTAPTPGCGDFPLEGAYFLSLSYEGGGPGSLAIDDQPARCVEFADFGNGWVDLFTTKADDKSGGGKAIVFGDIVLKAAGVSTDVTSWGSIKSLFK